MCLIAFAIGCSARWPLVVAANRDEYFDRPTSPLARWTSPVGQTLISGRDLRAGGAWFGITPDGRVAFVTNVRERPAAARPRSRGELVTRWLESRGDAAEFLSDLSLSNGAAGDDGEFAGFNLVVGDLARQRWSWITNRSATAASGSSWQTRKLTTGVYGLSNAQLDTPWPKTERIKQALKAALEADAAGASSSHGAPASPGSSEANCSLKARLWAALADHQPGAPPLQPGIPRPATREDALSSAFVNWPEGGYGTCSSALLTAEALPVDSSLKPAVHSLRVSMRERQRGSLQTTGEEVFQLAVTDWPVAPDV